MIDFSTRSLGSRANLYLKLCSCLFTACAGAMAQTGKIKAVLVDLSGTLHIENRAIPGAVEALKRLRTANLNVRFVTNTTKESKQILLERLQNQGFEIQANEMFTSLTAARNLVEAKGLRPMLLLEDAALEDYNGILLDDPNAVVVGLAPSKLNYQTMQIAFSLLLTGAPLIAIHKGRYYKRSDGLALGPGPFVVGLEYATDSKAIVVGKPEKTFFLEALRGLDCEPETTIMIGDDVRDDIEGAQNAGMRGILVKTGKYRDLDEQKITPPPSVVCEDFSAAVNVILSKLL